MSSGDIVGFDCLDASNGQLTAESTTADLETLVFDQVDQVNGPVEVAGAEPGDSLQIDILELAPADWGWTANIPGFGLLADDFPAPFYKVTAVPGAAGAPSTGRGSTSRWRRSAARWAWPRSRGR